MKDPVPVVKLVYPQRHGYNNEKQGELEHDGQNKNDLIYPADLETSSNPFERLPSKRLQKIK